MTVTPIVSPCIKVCAVDGETGWCLGCGRSLEEIVRWVAMGEAGRDAVMDELAPRMDALKASGKLGSAT